MLFFRKISIIFLLRCVKLTGIVTLYCLSNDYLLFNPLDNTEERIFCGQFYAGTTRSFSNAPMCVINPLTPRRTQVSPYTEISILF